MSSSSAPKPSSTASGIPTTTSSVNDLARLSERSNAIKSRPLMYLMVGGGAPLRGFLFSNKSDDSILKEVMNTADALYLNQDMITLYNTLKDLLDQKDDVYKHPEIFWRCSRAAKEMATLNESNKEKHRNFTYEALELAQQGLDVDPDHWACNKWYGIMLDLTARLEGTKKRIQNSYLVKEHLLKACKANPHDATTIHSLGVWCYEFADLPWYQQKIASALFATPPKSSYEEALEFLLKAEEVDPDFYSQNLLYLGKCYERLKFKVDAQHYLSKCVNYPGNSAEDNKAKEEAANLLKKIT